MADTPVVTSFERERWSRRAIGAFTGLAALAVVFGLVWSITHQAPVPEVVDREQAAIAAYRLRPQVYAVGECRTWDQATVGATAVVDGRVSQTVDCASPHRFEVTGTIALPPETPYPTSTAEWDATAAAQCTSSADAYFGIRDPQGRFVITSIVASEPRWRDGTPEIVCGIALRNGEPHEGNARNLEQQDVREIGLCTNVAIGLVDCSVPHDRVITGYADLTVVATTYADDEAQATLVRAECESAGATYLARNPGETASRVGWITISEASWAADARVVHCTLDA